jgi:hypothetical protein
MRLTFLTIALLVVASCKEESKLPDDCIMPVAFNDWRLESFKNAYNIQFPEYFIGMGMQGFEGNMFERYNPDSSIMISYAYCNELYCADFGDTLPVDLPDQLYVINSPIRSSEIELVNKKYFCSDDQMKGILYYSNDAVSLGKFYMLGYGGYLEAATLLFSSNKLDTVCLILSTINERISPELQ